MGETEPDIKEARKRSVDNLQRLYTFIVSLAVTESLRRLLNVFSDPNTDYLPKVNTALMFLSLIVTVIPFYHGANRYLDATYVTGERHAKREALAIDFLMLFIEGLIIFGLAVFTNNSPVFYSILGGLFIFDAIWVWSTNLTALTDDDKYPALYKWSLVNIFSAILLFILVWSNFFRIELWANKIAESIALVSVAIGRTVYDYMKVWDFYYPKGDKDYGLVSPPPAPLPAERPDPK